MDSGWIRAAREAMRVRFEIAIFVGDESGSSARANALAAAEEALETIERIESRLSAFWPGSDIWEINHAEPRKPVKVQVSTVSFLARAQEISLLTDGAFDPTVGPLMRLYFDGDDAPTDAQIADTLACVGMARVVGLDFDTQTVWRTRETVRIDPGAMGKGWALDRARDTLEDCGVACALLHAGTSSVQTIGSHPQTKEFEVAVADPNPENDLFDIVRLWPGGSALGVSAPHAKWKSASGETNYGGENFEQGAVGHVIDPRTGRPTRAARIALAVARSAADADALSTALLVLGNDAAHSLEERLPGIFLLASPA